MDDRRIGRPAEADFPDRQVFLEPQPQQLDTLDGLGPALFRPVALQPTGLGHDRLRPGPVKEAGLAGVIRREFR